MNHGKRSDKFVLHMQHGTVRSGSKSQGAPTMASRLSMNRSEMPPGFGLLARKDTSQAAVLISQSPGAFPSGACQEKAAEDAARKRTPQSVVLFSRSPRRCRAVPPIEASSWSHCMRKAKGGSARTCGGGAGRAVTGGASQRE